MSALTAAPVRHAAGARRPARPALRLVSGPGAGRPAAELGLAPVSVAQAWRRRIGTVLLLASVLALLLVATMSAVDSARGGATLDATPVATATVVVQPGETLWQVAAANAPGGMSTPAYVEAISEANGLQSPVLQTWQVLVLPAG